MISTPVRITACLGSLLFLASCTGNFDYSLFKDDIEKPAEWTEAAGKLDVLDNWLLDLRIEPLSALVETALESNSELQRLALDVGISAQSVTSERASFWPDLNLTFSRQRQATKTDVNPTDLTSFKLESTLELDVWGKLSDAQREATLNLNVAKANYEQARQDLAGDIATEWVNIAEAQQLLDLFEQRVVNAQENRVLIESSYDRGLKDALDIFLVRTTEETELSNIAAQKDTIKQSKRALSRLLGDYPEAAMEVSSELPPLTSPIRSGLPSEIIERRADLVASWNDLLSKNAALAYAHKQRLPSLNITGSFTESAGLPKYLFNGTPIAWSLLGAITAPVFDAGRLKAAEDTAFLELKKAEHQFLADVFDAFEEVENAIAQEKSLREQYRTTVRAEESARIANELAFDQYQNGVVDYVTVLDSQTRFYDALSSVIQIKSDLLRNRIRLHVALGGDFGSEPQEASKVNHGE